MKSQKPKVAIVGDSFIDKYCFGEVRRISPEAPIPILEIPVAEAGRHEERGGGAINVANNLFALGVEPMLFTITNMRLPYSIVSPKNCRPIVKTRFICKNHQMLQVDEPCAYCAYDLERMDYPRFEEFNIIAFIDHDKGVVKSGKATIVDSKKKDLSVFDGSEILKINRREYEESINKAFLRKAFITKDKDGIDYYENGKFIKNCPAVPKEVVDICGAGDTVTAILIYCLVKNISDPQRIMELANKAAGIAISRFGVSIVSLKELKK